LLASYCIYIAGHRHRGRCRRHRHSGILYLSPEIQYKLAATTIGNKATSFFFISSYEFRVLFYPSTVNIFRFPMYSNQHYWILLYIFNRQTVMALFLLMDLSYKHIFHVALTPSKQLVYWLRNRKIWASLVFALILLLFVEIS